MTATKRPTKRELFDIKEYSEKVRGVLQTLEQTQRPGEANGKGGKVDVLVTVKAEIKTLMDKGYTAQQIATAITDADVFKILPKTLTEIAVKPVRKGSKRTGSLSVNKTRNERNNGLVTTHAMSDATRTATKNETATFQVKPDSGKDEL